MTIQTEGKYDFSKIEADRLAEILDKWVVERTEETVEGKCLYIRTVHDLMEPLPPGGLISTLGFCIYKVQTRGYTGMVVEYSDGSESIHGMFDRKDLLYLEDKVRDYLRTDTERQISDAIDEIKKAGRFL